MISLDCSSLAGLFAAAFLAATLLPGSSEAALTYLALRHPAEWPVLFVVATLGNVAGAVLNYGLGRGFARFAGRRWFPASMERLHQASTWIESYGSWTLLFSWLPIIGDPLTVAAGILRMRPMLFLLLVTLGKAGRYAVLLGALMLGR